jgi:hypothetical protein
MVGGMAAGLAAVAFANCEGDNQRGQTYNLELSYEDLQGLVSRFEFQRSVENAAAAAVGSGLIIGDLFMLTGTGVVGFTVGVSLCATYVWFHLEPVPVAVHRGASSTKAKRTKPRQRFIDTSPQMMMLLGLMEYHTTK